MNIQEVKENLTIADHCGHVLMISGLHGIGKSEGVTQYTAENSMHFEPLILSLMDTGDLIGIPETRLIGGIQSTVWAAPSWYSNVVNKAWPSKLKVDRLQFNDTDFRTFVLEEVAKNVTESDDHIMLDRESLNNMYCYYYNAPNDRIQLLRQENVTYLDAQRSVIFLDEFNRAPTDILNASLQLVLDHRLHCHELPIVNGKETMIVVAVNPADGGNYTVQEFDDALMDRLVVNKVEADLESWLKWSKDKVPQVIRDFLIDKPTKFHHVPKDGSKGASPRSWTRLGKYIAMAEENGMTLSPSYIGGTVGSALAAEFIMFFSNYHKGMTVKVMEKELKAAISKAKKKGDFKVEPVAETMTDIVEKLEAVNRSEYADYYFTTYLKKKSVDDALPLMVYLYALPLESLGAVLKTLQSENTEGYAKLARFDMELNNKQLFRKLLSKVQDFT